ncbi:MAG: hypothetical protein MJ247_07105 [Alphaproteobacteria bacterium]|nr:hypothetical protein [Alphaproteobacteria bacterium]
MKKSFVIVYIFLLAIFALAALGAFNYGFFTQKEEFYSAYNKRKRNVNKKNFYNVKVLYNEQNAVESEYVEAIKIAFQFINKKAGKEFFKANYEGKISSLPDFAKKIQNASEDLSLSAVIGPFTTDYVRTGRTLSHMYGLPLVTPYAERSERLPELELDNYVTFYVPVSKMVDAILSDIKNRNVSQILYISSDKNTYGDIFASIMERNAQQSGVYTQNYRLSYQSPLSSTELLRTLRNYAGTTYEGAIVFAGPSEDFVEFYKMITHILPNVLVYGTDLLDNLRPNKELYENKEIYLPVSYVELKNDEFEKFYFEKTGKNISNNSKFGPMVVFAMFEALKEMKKYDPILFIEKLNKKTEKIHESSRVLIEKLLPDYKSVTIENH